jgi:hypothetical protein
MGVVSSWVSRAGVGWYDSFQNPSPGAMIANLQVFSLPAGPEKAFHLLNYSKWLISI